MFFSAGRRERYLKGRNDKIIFMTTQQDELVAGRLLPRMELADKRAGTHNRNTYMVLIKNFEGLF